MIRILVEKVEECVEKILSNTEENEKTTLLEIIDLYIEALEIVSERIRTAGRERVINYLNNFTGVPRPLIDFLIRHVIKDDIEIIIAVLRESKKRIETRQPHQEQVACLHYEAI
ncbi:MAG: hypothetical protein AB1341_15525 [Bacillota bacterium]